MSFSHNIHTRLAPVACSVGTYSLDQYTECVDCPAGYKCETTNQLPTACVPGTYSVGSQDECTACDPGYACPSTTDGSAAFACAPGKLN